MTDQMNSAIVENAQAAEDLARAFAGLSQDSALEASVPDTFQAVAHHAVALVEGAEDCSITVWNGSRRFRTVAATGELPLAVDAIQYEAIQGPCVDAVIRQGVFWSDEVGSDPRWPDFGRRAAERTGVASMVSHRLRLDEQAFGALNLYSCVPAAFGEHSVNLLDVYTTYASSLLSRANLADKGEHLEAALKSNRTIGVAIGILMASYKVTRDDAFGLLRLASQHGHVKLHVVAEAVVDTGQLDPERLR
jgi:transcriptional regulator with GAF, ATPase, and Fis domain